MLAFNLGSLCDCCDFYVCLFLQLFITDCLQNNQVQQSDYIRADTCTVIKEENILEDSQHTSSGIYTVYIKEEPILHQSDIHNLSENETTFVKSERTLDTNVQVDKEFIHHDSASDPLDVNIVIKEELSMEQSLEDHLGEEVMCIQLIILRNFCVL